MSKQIDIEFNDKKYTIEFNRETVLRLMEKQTKNKSQDGIDTAYDFIYFGLLKNHKDEMPDKDTILGWIVAMGEPQEFINAISECVQEVITVIESDKKQGNFKWGVRK